MLEPHSPFFRRPERWGIDRIAPKWIYRYIYPEQRVRLASIACQFDFSWKGREEDPGAYIAPVQELVAGWQRSYSSGEVRFTCRRGPGFLELMDTRPLPLPGAGPVRKTILTGMNRLVYECCESGRTFPEIAAHIQAARTGPVDGESIRRSLREFLDRRLMIQENGRYLSLAVSSGR